LYDKLGLSFEAHEDWTLVDYANYARKADVAIPEGRGKASTAFEGTP